MVNDDWETRFREIWEYREETLYPQLFGAMEDGIYPLDVETFESFGQPTFDPRWLTIGVCISPPNANRQSWLYVSSGLSNALNDHPFNPDDCSGIGCEFVFETTEKANWAIRRVHDILVFQLLLTTDFYGDEPMVGYGSRIPIGEPIKPDTDSALRFLLVTKPQGHPSRFQQESGYADFLALVGISESEKQFAKAEGNEKLLPLLMQAGAFPITRPERQAVV